MIWLLSLVYAADWNLEIERALISEVHDHVQNVIDGSVVVSLEELGVQVDSPCQELDRVDIRFPAREDFRGLVSVQAFLFEKGELCQRLKFQSRLRIMVTLPVAKKSVQALEEVPITEAQVRYDQLQGTPISSVVGPWIARTNLKKMEPLTEERVKLKPLNYEGDQVAVLLKTNSLEIQTKGKLMSDAYVNSRVRVLVLATSVVLDGILIKKDNVEIIGKKP
jgi:flagella basal body P-ring formation protein FlgA